MGYNDSNYQPVIVDLEAIAIEGVDNFLDPVSAPANYKDPEKIEAAIKEKRQALIERAALNPHLCRLVVMGIDTRECFELRYIDTEAQEIAALEELWGRTNDATCPIVTFNGLRYDLLVLLARSFALGVKAPDLDLKPWGLHGRHDLYQILSFGGAASGSLDFFAKRYGVEEEATEEVKAITGADVARLWAEGRHDLVGAHCEYDIKRTRALARRVKRLGVSW